MHTKTIDLRSKILELIVYRTLFRKINIISDILIVSGSFGIVSYFIGYFNYSPAIAKVTHNVCKAIYLFFCLNK
jgi:hypothetical protein